MLNHRRDVIRALDEDGVSNEVYDGCNIVVSVLPLEPAPAEIVDALQPTDYLVWWVGLRDSDINRGTYLRKVFLEKGAVHDMAGEIPSGPGDLGLDLLVHRRHCPRFEPFRAFQPHVGLCLHWDQRSNDCRDIPKSTHRCTPI